MTRLGFPQQQQGGPDQLKAPTAGYNLEGIKGRIKERLESLREVNSRHESDLDRVVDNMVQRSGL